MNVVSLCFELKAGRESLRVTDNKTSKHLLAYLQFKEEAEVFVIQIFMVGNGVKQELFRRKSEWK